MKNNKRWVNLTKLNMKYTDLGTDFGSKKEHTVLFSCWFCYSIVIQALLSGGGC